SGLEEVRAVKTHWQDIWIISAFYLLAYTTYQALTIPLYSFLQKIDKDASIEFYGFITSAFKVKYSFYKYVVLVVFLMHATAEGSIIIVRSYVPRISLPEDRAAAYGIKNGAVLLSIILGP
ncbi:hypothetical protein PMAYCL1PPCAC_05747, partial [Pristionchus mayeri]